MKVIKPVEKTVLDNKSFLNNKFIHEVNEINKKFITYTGPVNCKKVLPKQIL